MNKLLFVLALGVSGAQAANWHVRADGGDAMQCTGKTDAALSPDRNCAFKNPFYLWTNDPPQMKPYEKPLWKIAGGDTVIIKKGDYKMGWKIPQSSGWWNYYGCRGNNRMCYNPPIPAGAPGAPTRIVGEEWQSGCKIKSVLRGAGAANTILNLNDTHDVDVECLEFSDNDQCRSMTMTGEPYPCVMYTSDHAYTALQTNTNTHDLTLRNLFIHGMAASAINGGLGPNVLAEDIHLRGNGNIGWNIEAGNGKSSGTGPLTIRRALIEWTACVERFPLADPVILACYDQAGANANGDGIGFGSDFAGDVTIDHSTIRYNQQDGLDALYIRNGSKLHVTNSQFYGNEGQQIKTGGSTDAAIRDNLIVGNCQRLKEPVNGVTEAGFNAHLKGFCRAGDYMANMLKSNSGLDISHNTLITYHSTTFDIQCRSIVEDFSSLGRVTQDDPAIDATLATDGARREFPVRYPIEYVTQTGAVYIYAPNGTRAPKMLGKEGDTNCYGGVPCNFWYRPGTNLLWQDPADPPLLATDRLNVTYSNKSYCSTARLSLDHNIIRAYKRLGVTELPGVFWFANAPAAVTDATKRTHNSWCGFKAFAYGPTETVLSACPGTWFASEPLTLAIESDLDALDARPNAPLSGRGADSVFKPR